MVSTQRLSLSVVLATFNERDNLGPMLEQLRTLLGQHYQLELIVVDDDSPDGTSELVRQLGRVTDSVRQLSGPGGGGTASSDAW